MEKKKAVVGSSSRMRASALIAMAMAMGNDPMLPRRALTEEERSRKVKAEFAQKLQQQKEEKAKRETRLKKRGLKKFTFGNKEYWALSFDRALKKAERDGYNVIGGRF